MSPSRGRRGTSHSSRSQRRKFVWSRHATAQTIATTGAPGTLVDDALAAFEVAGASKLGITIATIKFDVTAKATGTAGANADFKLGWVVGPNVISTTTDYAPTTHSMLDWMYINTFYVAGDGRPLAQPDSRDACFTIKSKRRIQELNQTLWCVLMADFDGNTALNVTVNASYGILLP